MRYRIVDELGRELAGADTAADLLRLVQGYAEAERMEAERRSRHRRLWAAEGYSSLWGEEYGGEA